MNTKISPKVYSAMQENRPFKVYKKTILGQVAIQILNPFSDEPEVFLLRGNHLNNDEGCFIEFWNERQHEFFRKMNKFHLTKGYLIPVELESYLGDTQKDIGIDYSAITDKDIDDVLNSKFLALRAHLNKVDSEPYILRVLDRADALEKSDKIIAAIKS